MDILYKWVLSFIVVLLMTWAVPARPAQDRPDIRIGIRPTDTVEEIPILFETDSQTATVPVFIDYAGSSTLKDVHVYGQLTDCGKKHLLTIGQVQFLRINSDQPAGPLTLTPDARQQRLRLRISDLGEKYGTFCGYLAAEINGRHYTYTDLQIERPASPTLTIREVKNGEIYLNTHQPTLDQAIFIAETGGKTGVKDLRISISPLRTEGGDTIRLKSKPISSVTEGNEEGTIPSISLSANGSERVIIEGNIPNVTSYKGVLRLEWDNQMQEYPLLVERKPGIQAVTIDTIAPVERAQFPYLTNWIDAFSKTGLDIPITLKETTGNRTQAYVPVLTQLHNVIKDETVINASFSGWGLYRCDDGTEIPQKANLLSFEGYQKKCVRFTIRGLNSHGHLKGKVAVTSPSGVEDTVEINIHLRHHWLMAAIVIFLGTLSSYKIRHWLAIGRPTRLNEIKIVRLMDTIRDRISEPNDLVRLALLGKLKELRQTLQIDSSLDVDARLKEQVAQLNTYLPVYTILHLELEKTIIDPEKRQEAQQRLKTIKTLLAGADPLANLKQANEKAVSLRAEIKKWNQDHLKSALENLRQAIQNDKRLLNYLKIDDAACQRLKNKLAEIEQKLPASEEVNRAYETARTAYEDARTDYIQMTAERLQLILQGQERPAGFSQAEWETERDELLKQLNTATEDHADDISALQRAIEQIRGEYLQVVITRLKDWAEQKATELEADIKYQQNVQTLRHEVITSLETAEKQSRQGDLNSAEHTYSQAAKAYADALPPDEQGTIQDQDGRVQADAPALTPGTTSDPGGPSGQEPPQEETVPEIIKDIRTRDRHVMYLVSIISVLSGLLLLWSPNSTFGNLADYIGVFLWGVGLHELNKVGLPAAATDLQLPYFPKKDQRGNSHGNQS